VLSHECWIQIENVVSIYARVLYSFKKLKKKPPTLLLDQKEE
jgi:hypothetical protein